MTHPATTSTAASAMLAAPSPEEQPAYRYAGHGAFLPANQTAIDECQRSNAWVDDVNSRPSKGRLQ